VSVLQQLRVFSLLDDLSLIEHDDGIRSYDSGQAKGYDNGRAALDKPLQGLVNKFFRGRVQVGGGFIQDENGGIFQECAGDRVPDWR
jgi:hypothetical protein